MTNWKTPTLAFAYPGSSELRLCHSIRRGALSGVTLLNAHGDAEAVFMASGAARRNMEVGLALLHGARGLTNALGAIAEARRDELPVVCLVGVPGISVQPFLPPNYESDLIEISRQLAKPDVPKGNNLQERIADAIRIAAAPPFGPVLVEFVDQPLKPFRFEPLEVVPGYDNADLLFSQELSQLRRATQILSQANFVAILVDDYICRWSDETIESVGTISEICQAPIFQVPYRRGAMLHWHASSQQWPYLCGFLDLVDHATYLASCDVIMTVEDRNMYPRAIGNLPTNAGIVAFTSNESATRKNGYLKSTDCVVQGGLSETLVELAKGLTRPSDVNPAVAKRWPCTSRAPLSVQGVEVAAELVTSFVHNDARFLVDDSQMLGGLLAKSGLLFDASIDIHGSHGGFVGFGLAAACGAASATPGERIVCLLGDHGFLNGIQALSFASRLDNLTIIVCKNGGSVSLDQEASIIGTEAGGAFDLLSVSGGFDYVATARGFGLRAELVDYSRMVSERGNVKAGLLFDTLSRSIAAGGATLIELSLPESGDFWTGVWASPLS